MKLRWLAAIALAAFAVSLTCVYDHVMLHFLGWDGQGSDNYAAWSGSLPALFTLLGLSTIITGLWSHVNCHEPGCWRIGKHKVSGTPWCTAHHGQARSRLSVEELLERILRATDAANDASKSLIAEVSAASQASQRQMDRVLEELRASR
jgi:hypothetical protein